MIACERPRRRRSVHRGRRPCAHRARPPGRSRVAQRAARHRAAGFARRAARHATRSSVRRGCASSPPAMPSGASSSATFTTAPSSTCGVGRQAAPRQRRSRRRSRDAEAMIDEVRGDLQDAIAELRALAHGIFPPLLMSGGLAEALAGGGGTIGAANRHRDHCRPPQPGDRGSDLLLLHGGVAERRQACRRTSRRSCEGVGGRSSAPLAGRRQRHRFRSRRLRQAPATASSTCATVWVHSVARSMSSVPSAAGPPSKATSLCNDRCSSISSSVRHSTRL